MGLFRNNVNATEDSSKQAFTLGLYSIYDSKAEAYLPIFSARSHAIAVRMFAQAANDSNHDFCRWPADYTLFCVGYFQELTGDVVPIQAKLSLGNAIQYNKKEEEDNG